MIIFVCILALYVVMVAVLTIAGQLCEPSIYNFIEIPIEFVRFVYSHIKPNQEKHG